MGKVQNLTSFVAGGDWVRGRDGGEVWLVAVRCTFTVDRVGTTSVAEEQDPETLAPKYRGDPATSSLLYDSDYCLTKPTTDVLLHGHAYSPGGKPTAQVDVTMRVGDIQKTLRVTGDRRGRTSSSAALFTRMPLIYERAYGGREPDLPRDPDRPRFEPRNPVGTGFVAETPAPNVAYPGGVRPAVPPGSARSPRSGSRVCSTPEPTTRRGNGTAARSTRPTWTTDSSSARPRTSGRRNSSAAGNRWN